MNVTTRQFQAFLAVARLASFTRAAEEIFVTQAGLSLMLKDLEAQVGARLFDRTTRSVHLTAAGEAMGVPPPAPDFGTNASAAEAARRLGRMLLACTTESEEKGP